jgi:hypothetical protein
VALGTKIASYEHASSSEMVQVVRAEMLACLAKLEDCNSRARHQRRRSEIANRSGSSSVLEAENAARWREVELWGRRMSWLEDVRWCLRDARNGGDASP